MCVHVTISVCMCLLRVCIYNEPIDRFNYFAAISAIMVFCQTLSLENVQPIRHLDVNMLVKSSNLLCI